MAELPALVDGKLPAYAWPGGYPIIYYTVEMGRQTTEIVCAACATESLGSDPESSWTVWGCDTYDEGPDEQCTNCYKDIPSAYGDPDGGADAGDER